MKVTLKSVEPIAKNIYTFWFEPERPLKHVAGQFIELRIKHDQPDKRGDKRWFTLSSSPSEQLVSITTKIIDESSSFKKALKALEIGDIVEMSSPMGDFTLPKDMSVPVVLVAGGIGCTPFRSMAVNSLAQNEQRSLSLLYAANELDEVAFKDAFGELGPDNITIILSKPASGWKGLSGRIDAQMILDKLSDKSADALVYISGPEPMAEALAKQLKDAGFNKKQIKTDFFPGYTEI